MWRLIDAGRPRKIKKINLYLSVDLYGGERCGFRYFMKIGARSSAILPNNSQGFGIRLPNLHQWKATMVKQNFCFDLHVYT